MLNVKLRSKGNFRTHISIGLFMLLSTFAGSASAELIIGDPDPQHKGNLPIIKKNPRDVKAIRDNTVGILTGLPTGVYARMGNDIRRLLDDRENHTLRLATLIGSGSVNNLDDLRNLPGVSLAIVQGDVLEEYAADREQFAFLKKNIRAVSRLHTEILHVITRKDVVEKANTDTICALANGRVNVGGLGSGTAITVRKVFNSLLKLNVTLDKTSQDQAFDQLASRQVDAVAFVVGRRAPFFANDNLKARFAKDQLEWLTVPQDLLDSGCSQSTHNRHEPLVYESTSLSHKDYPELIAQNKTVPSIGVPAILAAYSFDDVTSARSQATAKFIRSFLSKATEPEGFGQDGGGYDANWCDVDVKKTPQTWRRHSVTEEWLNERRSGKTVISCAPSRTGPSSCPTDTDLVVEFEQLRRREGRTIDRANPGYMRDFVTFVRAQCP